MPHRLRSDVGVYAGCFLSAFVLRVAHFRPTVTPDGRLYLRIAENLLRNGCYSDSLPGEALCHPTWGNQPPGYPAFLVLVKLLTTGTPAAIVVAQCLVYALAVLYALVSARRCLQLSGTSLLCTGMLLSISPLTTSWSQWVLTETLAAAATLWVVTECLRSLTSSDFRTRHLAVALASSVLVRWDLVWLVVPVTLVAWHLRAQEGIVMKMGSVLSTIAFAMLLLVARAVMVGLPAIPSSLNAGPDELPPGVVSFWTVAAVKQTATSSLLWNVWNRRYPEVGATFDYESISRRADTPQLHATLEALAAAPPGQAVPAQIDESFAIMATEIPRRERLAYWARVMFARAVAMWSEQDSIFWSGWFTDHEAYLRIYRVVLLSLVLIAPLVFPRGSTEHMLAGGVFLFVLLRTAFLVGLTALEIRYTTPAIPAMELVVALLAVRWRAHFV